MKTIAKGVETQGELDYLKRAGCTEGQGYLFGKVVPPGEAHGLLKVRPDRTQAAA
jgi:EAL domain-containing protein (putative c-di-GMP-specific phosphodiesterase class I)